MGFLLDFNEMLMQKCLVKIWFEEIILRICVLSFIHFTTIIWEAITYPAWSRHLVLINEQDLSLCTEASSLVGKTNISIMTIKYSEVKVHTVLGKYRKKVWWRLPGKSHRRNDVWTASLIMIELNVGNKTIKLWEENMGENLSDTD